MNRRAFLRSTVAATGCLLTTPGWGADARQTLGEEELLAEANARISQHRQGEGVITVHDAAGRPARGATVKVEQLRQHFLFGCNVFRLGRVRDPEREAQYRQRFAALLNFATLGFYWGSYERRRGQPDYEYTEQVVTWCREHGITCKGHPLAWDHPAGSPRWLPGDHEELKRLSTARVRDIVTRFRGRIDTWDVVNEATDLSRFHTPMNDWANALGAVPYTRLHLQAARAANPPATLLVNDYRHDPPYFDLLRALRDEGGQPLFDAIGLQSHMHSAEWRLSRAWQICERFVALGRPLHFTEVTVLSGEHGYERPRPWPSTPEGEARQADYVPKFYTLLFAHPAVQAITWWDFSDDGAWQGAPAGWLRRDMSPKPVYERLLTLLKGAWWTKTEGRTDERGEFKTRAFFGTHRVTATLSDGKSLTQELHWQRAAANRFELSVGKEGCPASWSDVRWPGECDRSGCRKGEGIARGPGASCAGVHP